jgi:hypothetical protein
MKRKGSAPDGAELQINATQKLTFFKVCDAVFLGPAFLFQSIARTQLF